MIGISLRGVSKSFDGQNNALDGVDLTIQSGEFFTLLGPSGCGKTTLLRVLAGLEPADAGEVMIGGRPMQDVPAHARSVNTVFQSYALFPHRNVWQNIAFGMQMRRRPKDLINQAIRDMAELIGIDALLDRRVDQLSGGQRQRVALARALVNEPEVLLLDEPLSALDAGLRARLQVELKRLQRRLGMTFVFVTHDQEEAMVMSDRIAVLNHGQIVQIGEPRALYEQPANRFIAEFMGHDNLLAIQSQTSAGVQTALGWIAGAFPQGRSLLLRREALSVQAPATAHAPDFIAQVTERLYRGGVTEYRLDCQGTPVVASTRNRGQALFEPGESVAVHIAPAGTAVLAD